MIRFEQVGFTHHGADTPVLAGVDLEIDEGELCLLVGPTGSGKSTLLRTINGLVPHFSGGELTGQVSVAGRSTARMQPRELADVVGFVVQDPTAGFVTASVEDELAYAMESLGIEPSTMRRRVEETLDLLGIAPLRDRSLMTLSAGERQRVAIGSALTAHPQVLVLDEPTSALDPGAAEEVLAALHRLVHDLGVTVVVAEHRVERIVQFADRVIVLEGAGRPPRVGQPAEVLSGSPLAPPVVALGDAMGWSPAPVTVRDARRLAAPIRRRLDEVTPDEPGLAPIDEAILTARQIRVAHGHKLAVAGVDLELRAGERIALMGRNGAGKSSLLWALQGTGARSSGRVEITGIDPATQPPGQRRRLAGLVPSDPADLLYRETVGAELTQGDHDAGATTGSCRALLDRLVPGIPDRRHPRDLSEGQRLALALALTLVADPPVLLLDEPTRGLDLPGKMALVEMLAETGPERGVLLATHDVEFVAAQASRVLVMAEGEIVADGPTRAVVTGSPVFAPQVAKVLAPAPLLTVAELVTALNTSP